MSFRAILPAVLFAIGCAAPPPDSGLDLPRVEVIDLTRAFDAETIYWPTERPFRH